MTLLRLTDEEIVLLDSKCSQEIQKEVEKAKARLKTCCKYDALSAKEGGLIADICAHARTFGKLSFIYRQIEFCRVCGRNDGYHKYKCRSKYHRKGETNYDAPKTFLGVEFADDFIVIKNSIRLGACVQCIDKLKPLILSELNNIKAELPEALTSIKPKYIKVTNRACSNCGWKGHEGEMGRSPTLLGDQTYPSTCPRCKYEEKGLFTSKIEIIDGFTIIER